MEENRKAARRNRPKEGQLSFKGHDSGVRCVVRDDSKFGARVVLSQPYLVPFEFDFAIAGEAPRPARKVWVHDSEMGLQYTG